MGRCYYRCSRCRTRNIFRRPVKTYIRPKRCRNCGHDKFYVDKERRDRKPCGCLGSYWWGPHRWGSAYCEHNPDHEYHRALRDGAHPGELAWEGLGLKLHTGDTVPF